MSGAVRFSEALRLPPINRVVATVANTAVVPLSVGSGLLLYWVLSQTSPAPDLKPQQALLCIAAAVVVGCVCMVVGQRCIARNLRRELAEWRDRTAPGRDLLAASLMYETLIDSSRIARAAAVASYLREVPVGASRLFAVGDAKLSPVDDGSLFEECNALERHLVRDRRATVGVLAMVFIVHLFIAVRSSGINPLNWRGTALINLLPSAMFLLLILQALGVFKPVGKFVLAAPGRIEYTSMGRTTVFTIHDSVMEVKGFEPLYYVTLYRNDGARVSMKYQGLETVGFQQMLARWCMRTPALVEAAPSAGMTEADRA